MFAFDGAIGEHILFKVPVSKSHVPFDESVVQNLYSFSVLIEANGKRTEISAAFEGGFAMFSCSCLNTFCILSKAKKISQVICPRGIQIKTGVDGKLVVDFPEGCVTQTEEVSFKIIRPTITNIKESMPKWNPKLVIAVSDKICLKFTRNCLKTSIHVSFPIPGNKITEPGTEPRLIGFKNGKPNLLKATGKQIGDDILYEVQGCDGLALALVQVKNVQHGSKSQRTLKEELDIFYGSLLLCNIFLFIKTAGINILRLMATCVIQAEQPEVIRDNTNTGARCIFKSDTLCLHSLQRIRILASGGITPEKGYKNNFFLTFMCESKDNSITFPVRIKKINGHYGIIEFSLDNIRRGPISQVSFNLFPPYNQLNKHKC